MSYCVAFGCANRPADRAVGITFHRFPAETTIRQKWLTSMSRGDWTPDPSGRVCSVHFKQCDMVRNSPLMTKLKKDAFPCFFPQTFKHAIRNAKSNVLLADNTEMEVVELDNDDNESPNFTSSPTIEKTTTTTSTTTSITTSTTTSTTTSAAATTITSDVANKMNENYYESTGKTLFTIINEMANEMNTIRRKVNGHLKAKRKKNVRIKSQIEKLKQSLIEIKEQNVQNNPILASLFEHALKEPELTPLAEDVDENTEKTTEVLAPEIAEKFNPDSFASYLSTEMNKFSPEDLVLLKADIKNILAANKPSLCL